MGDPAIYLDLILNLTLLVALSVVSGFADQRWPRTTRTGLILQGVLFGTTTVIGMLRPLKLMPGLIFDGRSVMVSLCALYFGPLAGAVSGGIGIAARVAIGGVGVLPGVLTILSAVALGLLFRKRLRPDDRPPAAQDLLVVGAVVNAAMLLAQLSKPGGGLDVVQRIGVPVMLLYPLATILTGKLLSDQVEARQRLEALRASDERHRTILHTAMDGFWLLDLQGRLLEVNETYCRMSGYSAAELLGMSLSDLDVRSDAAEIATHIQRVVARGEDRFETRHRRQDGSLIDVEASVQYQPVDGGRLVVFMRDITAARRAEEEKAFLADQLQQAQKMESVGRLAGGVAHDFNNMLEVILGHTDLAIEQAAAGSPLQADLLEIRQAATRSADLTRQLLAFARKQTVTPRVLDLNATVAGMLRMLQRLIGESVALQWRPDPALWPVRMDPTQVDQVLANLCVNARDAIADVGAITIQTSNLVVDGANAAAHPGLRPGEYVRLAVQDDGCGMDAATLAHVFEPFFTTKGLGTGTGLGLATVYGVVQQNQGAVEATSEPGAGTTVTIYLPRHDEQGATRPAPAPPPDLAPVPVARGHETILLVEDEPAILRLTTRMLERQGYTVLAADGPRAALQLARERAGQIRLLLTDVVMPEMNGRDLSEQLQALCPDLKRLFVSGYPAEAIARHGVLEEDVQFIQKPFSVETLAAKVRAALDSG